MLVITVEVDAHGGQAIGIKEDLAMHLERFGDARVVAVEVIPDQRAISEVISERPGQIDWNQRQTVLLQGGGRSRGAAEMRCCLGCGLYRRSDPGLGPDGKVVWGSCAHTGKPIRDLKQVCQAWREEGGKSACFGTRGLSR